MAEVGKIVGNGMLVGDGGTVSYGPGVKGTACTTITKFIGSIPILQKADSNPAKKMAR